MDETYHSGCGAVAETLIVYLWHSGVLERLRQRQSTTVLEYGLGTGTGLLLTAALAEHYQTPLRFISLEQFLLPTSILQQLDLPTAAAGCLAGDFARTPELDPGLLIEELHALGALSDSFCTAVERWTRSGEQGWCAHKLSDFVELQLWLGDACQWRVADNHAGHDMHARPDTDIPSAVFPGSCDAVYFDPFSPDTHPELWTLPVFHNAALALRPGGRLTSYCVKSVVRRGLQAAGLQVAKGAGPIGGKREVLIASR